MRPSRREPDPGPSPVPLAPCLSARLFPWPPAAPGDPWHASLCALPLTHVSGRPLGPPPGRSPSEPLTQTHASGISATLPHYWRPSPATLVRVSAELHSKARSTPGRGEAGRLRGGTPGVWRWPELVRPSTILTAQGFRYQSHTGKW